MFDPTNLKFFEQFLHPAESLTAFFLIKQEQSVFFQKVTYTQKKNDCKKPSTDRVDCRYETSRPFFYHAVLYSSWRFKQLTTHVKSLFPVCQRTHGDTSDIRIEGYCCKYSVSDILTADKLKYSCRIWRHGPIHPYFSVF